MANTFTLIASSTVGSGGAASIDFTSIPSTYTDLVLKISLRAANASAYNSSQLSFNNSATGYSYIALWGNSTGAVSVSNTNTYFEWMYSDAANATANTFSNTEIYVPNYLSSNSKSVSFDNVTENNASTTNSVLTNLMAGLWSGTAAINSIKITAGSSSTFVQYSTAYLYGIRNS
jgi:hypothetical protein